MQWRQLQAEIMGWEEGPENQDFTPDRLDLPENELQEINTGTGGPEISTVPEVQKRNGCYAYRGCEKQ